MRGPEHKVGNKEAVLEKADEMKREIEGMPDGRRDHVFALACKLATIWSAQEIYDDLMDWAPDGNIEHHVEGAVESLESVDWSQAA